METEEIIQIPARFVKRITRLDGGTNNKMDALKIKDNQFADIQDFVHDPVGDMELRRGCAFITVTIGTDPVKHLAKFVRSTLDSVMLAAYGDKIGYVSRNNIIDLITGLTSASSVGSASYADPSGVSRHYICSDGDAVWVINSDLSTRLAGCVAPTVAPTVALNGAGVKNGNHYYAYTYLYPQGESNKSPTSVLISPSSQKVLVTIPGSYPSGCTGIRIYCTAAGSTILKELATITSPTLTYDDNNTDGVLGVEIPSTYGIPPVSKDIFIYKNYAYYVKTNSDQWAFSLLNYPEIVKTDAYENPIKDAANRPVAIRCTLNPNFLVVFYQHALIAYSGTSPFIADADPLKKMEINNDLGCVSKDSIAQIGGDLAFFGDDKRVHMINRVSLSISETIKPVTISENIEDTLQNQLNPAMLDKAVGLYWNRKYLLFVASKNSSKLDKVVWKDFNVTPEEPWSTGNPLPAAAALAFPDIDGNIQPFIGSGDSKKIYQFFSGTTDGATQIAAECTSKKWDMNYPFNMKDWEQLRIMGQATPEYSFKVRVYYQYGSEIRFKDFTKTGPAFGSAFSSKVIWGQGTWGQGNWCSNVSWSNVIAEFLEKCQIERYGEIMWFRIFDVKSTYSLKFTGFEVRGFIHRAN